MYLVVVYKAETKGDNAIVFSGCLEGLRLRETMPLYLVVVYKAETKGEKGIVFSGCL